MLEIRTGNLFASFAVYIRKSVGILLQIGSDNLLAPLLQIASGNLFASFLQTSSGRLLAFLLQISSENMSASLSQINSGTLNGKFVISVKFFIAD